MFKYFSIESRFERASKKYFILKKQLEDKFFQEIMEENINDPMVQTAVNTNSNLEFPPKVGDSFVSHVQLKRHEETKERQKKIMQQNKEEDAAIIDAMRNKSMQKILTAIEKGDSKFDIQTPGYHNNEAVKINQMANLQFETELAKTK